jgi:hypothetical protein
MLSKYIIISIHRYLKFIHRQRQDSNLRGVTAKGFQVLLLNHSDTLPVKYFIFKILYNKFFWGKKKKDENFKSQNFCMMMTKNQNKQKLYSKLLK